MGLSDLVTWLDGVTVYGVVETTSLAQSQQTSPSQSSRRKRCENRFI